MATLGAGGAVAAAEENAGAETGAAARTTTPETKETTEPAKAARPSGNSTKSGCNSFLPDTPVLLADGTTKPIDQLTAGDSVKATDPQTGDTKAEPITQTITTPNDQEFTDLKLTTDGTSSAPVSLTSTQHHPYWDATTNRWTDAADLKAGDQVRQANGSTATVISVRSYETPPTVTYNLTVDQLHTYYVLAGTTPVLVHNCNVRMTQAQADTLRIGPHADVSVPADGPVVSGAQSEAMQGLPCHTCGGTTPTMIGDHQPSTGFVRPGTPQDLYPHCSVCSDEQAAAVSRGQQILREHGFHDPTFPGGYGHPPALEFLQSILGDHIEG